MIEKVKDYEIEQENTDRKSKEDPDLEIGTPLNPKPDKFDKIF